MKIILSIGYQDILLPSDAGIATLLKTLGKGISCLGMLYDGVIETDGEPVQVRVEVVPDTTKLRPRGSKASGVDVASVQFPGERPRINGARQKRIC